MGIMTLLEGDSGDGKTTTAYTSRGRIAHIDIDNQAYLTVGRFPWLSPSAAMLTPCAGLQAGTPAIWHTVSPLDFTPDRIEGFVAAAGIGAGDTLALDPLSEYFGTLMDAEEYHEVTRGGERVNWRKLKVPYKALLRCLSNLQCDVVVTRRLGFEYDDKGVPTGKLRPEGEQAKTRYEFPFVWRLSDRGGKVVLTSMKKKGGFFAYGQEFTGDRDNPVLIRDIYAGAGVYDAIDAARHPKKADGFAAVVESAAMFENAVISVAEIKAEMDEANAAGFIENYRFATATAAKVAALSAAQKAEVKAYYEKISRA